MGSIRGVAAVRAGLLAAALLLALSGCMLASGQRGSADARPDAGNASASFLSAEGDELHQIPVGPKNTSYEVIVIVAVDQGELRLDVYDGSGVPAITVQARPDEQVTRSTHLSSNDRGDITYRVTARGARSGSYQILYRRL